MYDDNNKRVPNVNKSAEKRFSLSIKNIDINTHRAYKNVSNHHEETKQILRNPHAVLKENHDMRYPFGLTDQRFRWQVSKNLGENMELKGTLSKKYGNVSNQINVEKKYHADAPPGSWQSLILKTDPNTKVRNMSARDEQKLKLEHEKTKRTIIPQLNTAAEEVQIRSGKKRPPIASISKATGSIINLFDQTPNIQKTNRKFSGKIHEETIANEQGFGRLRNSKKIDYPRKDNNLLSQSMNIENSGVRSTSRRVKIDQLSSDIFGRDNNIPPVPYKRTRARVASIDEKFDPYKNLRSQIKFS